MTAILPAAVAVLLLGLIKAFLERLAARLSFRAARTAFLGSGWKHFMP